MIGPGGIRSGTRLMRSIYQPPWHDDNHTMAELSVSEGSHQRRALYLRSERDEATLTWPRRRGAGPARGRTCAAARAAAPLRARRPKEGIAMTRHVCTGFMVGAALALLLLAAAPARADETCMSPYMPKITGQEDYVYVW